MKKATIGAIGTIILVMVAVLLISGAGTKIYKAGKSFFSVFGIGTAEAGDKKTNTLSAAELAFDSFVSSYENCKSQSSVNCVCNQFDVSMLPDGYSIKLEQLTPKETTRIELYGNKPTPEKAKAIESATLCLYTYEKLKSFFYPILIDKISLDSGNYPYKLTNKVQLFKAQLLESSHTSVCFVSGTQETKAFNEATERYRKCGMKPSVTAPRFGMLDLSDYKGDYSYESFVEPNDDKASIIIENLNTLLLNNIAPSTRITRQIGTAQDRLERRRNMFNDAYKIFDQNKNGQISDDVYFISIRGLSIQAKNSKLKKDYFVVHYLQDSEQSKILAEKVKSKLTELNGKLIYNNEEKSNQAEAPAEYKFDFYIVTEANSKNYIGPVFLTCTESYSNFPACKESTSIPAVFIDIVEIKDDNHNMFEGHTQSIARKIFEGVKDYLAQTEIINNQE